MNFCIFWRNKNIFNLLILINPQHISIRFYMGCGTFEIVILDRIFIILSWDVISLLTSRNHK